MHLDYQCTKKINSKILCAKIDLLLVTDRVKSNESDIIIYFVKFEVVVTCYKRSRKKKRYLVNVKLL